MAAETPPPFQAVPIAQLPPRAADVLADVAPKRRRGRPPRDPNAPIVRRPRRAAKSLETQIGSALMTFNLALWAVPPTRNDALDDAEIKALAKAIDQQARVSPTFRKYLTTALEATSGGQLLSVVMVIGARRFARHEILLPKEADAMLGSMLENISNAPSVTPTSDDAPSDDDTSDVPPDIASRNGNQ